MMLAAGWLPDMTRLTGSTTRLLGAMPMEQLSCAVLTTCRGMIRRRVALGLRGRLRALIGKAFGSRSRERQRSLSVWHPAGQGNANLAAGGLP
jgi:hypothetical protein